jgi:hypothetical protein
VGQSTILPPRYHEWVKMRSKGSVVLVSDDPERAFSRGVLCNANTRAAISDASMSIFDQGDDSTDLRGPVALRGGGVAPSVARYPRNWASSLRELSAFAVCSVSFV